MAIPGAAIPEDHLRIWHAVKDAQAAALGTVREGALTRKPDEAARASLQAHGLEQYFTHRLGHGAPLWHVLF